MNMIAAVRDYLQKKIIPLSEKPAGEAYDAWSSSYDDQPGNLMLDLDEKLFSSFLVTVDLENKKIADVGCGTGRHWQKLYDRRPGLVIGFDVSEGMLDQLKSKFPDAMTIHSKDDRLQVIPDSFADCLVSTLTVAHIKNIEEAIAAWSRITQPGADLIITDFHPQMLEKGGKRSFRYEGKTMSVINYVHSLEKIKSILMRHGFMVVREETMYVNEEVKHYYETQHALSVYERYKGMPVIYGLQLKKRYAVD